MDWQRALSSDNLACTDLRLHGAVKGRTSHHERGPLNWCFPPRVLHAFDLTLRPMSGRSNRTLPQAASLRTDPHVCGSNSPAPDANSTTSGPSGFLASPAQRGGGKPSGEAGGWPALERAGRAKTGGHLRGPRAMRLQSKASTPHKTGRARACGHTFVPPPHGRGGAGRWPPHHHPPDFSPAFFTCWIVCCQACTETSEAVAEAIWLANCVATGLKSS